jgi:hypothetical protein
MGLDPNGKTPSYIKKNPKEIFPQKFLTEAIYQYPDKVRCRLGKEKNYY